MNSKNLNLKTKIFLKIKKIPLLFIERREKSRIAYEIIVPEALDAIEGIDGIRVKPFVSPKLGTSTCSKLLL